MAEDTTLNIGTTTAVTITINSVVDGASATASAIDFALLAPMGVTFNAVLDGSAGSTADVEWYMLWSDTATAADFTAVAVAPLVWLTTMQGTTSFVDHFTVVPIARYGKPHFVNQSGGDMAASGNTLDYWRIAIDQV